MLKRRIGALLPIKDGLVVRSTSFNKYLPVGKPAIAIDFLNQWGVDEIIMLDISASRAQKSISSSMVEQAVKKCFVPLAVGGGIQKMEEVDELIHRGADKIVLNQILFKKKNFLESVAKKYGDQCAVASIDVVKVNNEFKVYDYAAKSVTQNHLIDWANQLQDLGAGELLIQAVHRDGSYSGFEEEAYKRVCERVNIPVIAVGGAGSPEHFISLFKKTNVSAACAGNYFHFNEHSVAVLKSELIKAGVSVRHENPASYGETTIDHNNRIQKKSDEVLENMLYQKIEKEVI